MCSNIENTLTLNVKNVVNIVINTEHNNCVIKDCMYKNITCFKFGGANRQLERDGRGVRDNRNFTSLMIHITYSIITIFFILPVLFKSYT